MSRVSREARQDRGILQLLQALPADRLARILEELGVPAEQATDALSRHKPDPRRCTECGHGYYVCRSLDAKTVDPDARHDWSPDRSRSAGPEIPRQGE